MNNPPDNVIAVLRKQLRHALKEETTSLAALAELLSRGEGALARDFAEELAARMQHDGSRAYEIFGDRLPSTLMQVAVEIVGRERAQSDG